MPRRKQSHPQPVKGECAAGPGGGGGPAGTRGARSAAADAEDGTEETARAAVVLPGDLLLGRGPASEKGPPDTLVGKIAIPAYALSDDDCSSGYQQLSVESDPEEGGEPSPAALPCRQCGLQLAASLGQSCLQCAGAEGGRSQRIVYSCQLCPFASHYSSHLKRHMKTHNGEKPFACPQCAYASAQLVNLTRHLRTHTGEKPYRCTCCSFACSSLGNLKRHERVHSQDKPFQCAACDYRCNQSRNLKRHMLSHRLPEGEGPHRRDKDPEPLLPELSLHVGSGSGPFLPGCARLRGEEAAALPELLFPFTCRMCGLVLDDGFAQDEGLAEQVCGRCSLAVLGTEPGASPRKGTGDKGFACSLCPFVTHYPNHLARHMKTHSGEKPFACPLCPYASAHLDNLKRHQRVHTGEKPYKCQLCDYACGNLANLKRHGRIHSGDKPFQCSLCSYSCNQSMNLKRHMLRHTGEKPFQCRDCSYTTGHWDNYKRHQKIHGHTAESWVNPRNAKALLAPPAVGTALP
ncbi:zinc finger protein 513 isoform X2 [Poecile atricapillus]|uniref:zinc finger protein 513 isoform X2 n=1 Tax=Poecile atricapillus TaxID=48891 RepID=UPI0027394154|nr:zinc finger protein 513 isoform X2 [Poecile atricapillus]